MCAVQILFCAIILATIIGGSHAVNEEADNDNVEDLLFGKMGQKASAARASSNGNDLGQLNSDQKIIKSAGKEEQVDAKIGKKVKVEQQQHDNDNYDDQKQLQQVANKFSAKIKAEPIDDQHQLLLEKENGRKKSNETICQNPIKKGPKIEVNSDFEEKDWLLKKQIKINDDDYGEQKKQQQVANKLSAKIKVDPIDDHHVKEELNNFNQNLIKKEPTIEVNSDFEEKDWLLKKQVKINDDADYEEQHQQVANKLSAKIKAEPIVSGQNAMVGNKRWKEDHHSKEDEMPMSKRKKSNNFTKNFAPPKPAVGITSEEWKLVEKFDKMRKKSQLKTSDRHNMERKVARQLGTSREHIYELKKKQRQQNKKEPETEETKWAMIKAFDKKRTKYQREMAHKWGDRYKIRNRIEQKSAKELGTSRANIYIWKKELTPLIRYNDEQRREIIECFDKLIDKFINKFNMNTNKKIEEKIAKKFGVSRKTIYKWKN